MICENCGAQVDERVGVCPFCGATVIIRQFQDGPKHMTKCPNNPYK